MINFHRQGIINKQFRLFGAKSGKKWEEGRQEQVIIESYMQITIIKNCRTSFMSSSSNRIFQSIKNSDNSAAKSLSEGVIDDIEDMVDGENSTLLHVAANSNNVDMAEFYLKSYNQLIKTKPEKYTQDTKNMWLKARDNQGFSCLHYAVFRGNFKMVQLFQQNGADIYQINNQGLTVLHIAAQGDSPLLMYYFLNKGLKIGVADGKGSTPLHWACYSGMENAAYALISWGAQIDKQQFTFGMTPLHLAVMSGNGRIVKKLLLKGCDRNIRAYNNKLPLDIAKQNQYKNISDMIIDKQGIEQLMNIKTPFRKLRKHTFPFYLLLFLFLSNYLLNISFVLYDSFTYRLDLSITFLVIGFIVALLFFISKISNPGILKPQNITGNMFQILLKNKPTEICFDCKIVKPDRSRHCQICQSCICVYDHHCPWIANCVGAKNYFIFFSFLISMLLFMAFTIAFEIVNLIDTQWEKFGVLDTIRTICQLYSLVISVLFILPLIFLIVVQTKNTVQNRTTFERFGFQKAVSNSSATNNHRMSNHSNNSHKVSNVSEQLRMKLVERSQSSNSFGKPMEIEGQAIQEQEDNYARNCYLMCLGNSRVIKYQIAV